MKYEDPTYKGLLVGDLYIWETESGRCLLRRLDLRRLNAEM